jgi:hypothetical protein
MRCSSALRRNVERLRTTLPRIGLATEGAEGFRCRYTGGGSQRKEALDLPLSAQS